MRKLLLILLGILIFEVFCFFYSETNSIKVNYQKIFDEELASALEGIRVIHLSDLHIKRIGVREKKLLKIIKYVDPHIIFISGDFISGNKGIRPCIEVMKYMANGRTVIAVLGNSDHTYKHHRRNTFLLVKCLKRAGVTLLRNESARIAIKIGEKYPRELFVLGLDDNYLRYDDIFKAKTNLPKKGPKILVVHCPNIIEKIDTADINLILTGHSHGGQIVIPFIGPVYSNPSEHSRKRYYSGLYEEETKMYVNRGIGTSLVPFRIFCRPEVTCFEFKSRKKKKYGSSPYNRI
jgi:predicted MPP superfamily phosphohydrolase